MQAIYDVPAPAKLNLFLHVTGRRADGYHLLQSVFMLIDWHDCLHFELRSDGKISRADTGSLALPAEDLCVRAARALQTRAATAKGVHIVLDKRIPSEAGMGGGSSDAASCLLALNRLWQLHLPLTVLCDIGLGLGADVPFFLRGRNAWVEGVGERMTPVDLPAQRFLVLKPPQGLSTASVFSHPLVKRDSETATIADFAAAQFGFGRNDLEQAGRVLCPAIDDALDWFGRSGLQGRMTGSGSAVFAPVSSQAAGDAANRSVPVGWQLRKCANLGQHPLLGWCCGDS